MFTAKFAGNAGVGNFFKNKSVLIMGLGRFGGGVDVVRFLHKAGAKIMVTDLAPAEKLADSLRQLQDLDGIEYHLGSHKKNDFEEADIIVVNPAVTPENEFIEIARSKNKIVTYQINIFFELCPATIIGITGSSGKSTTSALTAHLLRDSRPQTPDSRRQTTDDRGQKTEDRGQKKRYGNVFLTGNIGNEPFLCLLERIKPEDLVVMEISSFQLEELAWIQKAPKVALLTNMTLNHLDRHGTFENYCRAKENIFKFQNLDKSDPAYSIFSAEDDVGKDWFEKYKNDAGRICKKFSIDDTTDEMKRHYRLLGRANLLNLSAAVSIVRCFGLTDEEIIRALPSFKALPHRLEFVAEIDGVSWYNDSIATTPARTLAALEAFEQPKILIAGGYDKKIPFDELGKEIAEKVKAAILIGATAPKIAEAIQSATEDKKKNIATEDTEKKVIIKLARSLAEAVDLARGVAEAGDVVLLSPACASYDMFENFQQRGREFAHLVLEKKSNK
jgi:UDP-N-acetylmuramoylalanine--D-glutamate ligase